MKYMETYQKRAILELEKDERPREKLAALGTQQLSEAELLALLLNSGTQELSAIDLARHLLRKFGSLRTLARIEYNELLQEKGIGPAKAARLLASFEVARRKLQVNDDVVRLFHPRLIARHLRPHMIDLNHEVIYGVFMNNYSVLLGEKLLSQGSSNRSFLDIKALLREAILRKASVVAIAHNHPSGNHRPSQADIRLTSQVEKACALMDIRLVDHLIITHDNYYSFQEAGYLPA